MEEEVGRWNSKEKKGIKLEVCPEIMTSIRYGGAQGDDDNEAVNDNFF